MDKFILTLDQGTTSSRAIIVDKIKMQVGNEIKDKFLEQYKNSGLTGEALNNEFNKVINQYLQTNIDEVKKLIINNIHAPLTAFIDCQYENVKKAQYFVDQSSMGRNM